MDLHYANAKPDWADIPQEQRTYWQRLATRSHGIVTPGNITSVTGGLLTGAGIICITQKWPWAGIVLMAIGRLLDIADGALAERTKTKSPLGEAVDATIDKLALFAFFIVFTAADILPAGLALLLIIDSAAAVVCGAAAKAWHAHIRPVRSGKLGTVAVSYAVLCFLLRAALPAQPAIWFTAPGYTLAALALGLHGYATVQYGRAAVAAWRRRHNRRP